MAKLDADPGRTVVVDEIHQPPPARHLGIVIQPQAMGGDPATGTDRGHLGHHQPGATQGASAVMDQMNIIRRAIRACAIDQHRRHHHPVGQGQPPQPERREQGWRGRRLNGRDRRIVLCHGGGGACGEPPFHLGQPRRIAQPQILVAHPLAAGQQRIGELDRIEMLIAAQRLEPFGRVARGVLQFQHLDPADVLVVLQGGRQPAGGDTAGRAGIQHLGQLDRILDRKLGARSDRPAAPDCPWSSARTGCG